MNDGYGELRKRVEERASEAVLHNLFDAMVNLHAKHEWRDCECTYCAVKRKATHYVGLAEYPPGYTGERIVHSLAGRMGDFSGKRDYIFDKRAVIRDWFRDRLSNLIA